MRHALITNLRGRIACIVLMLACAAWPGAASPVEGSEKVREQLTAFAKTLAKLLEGQGQDSIALGQFTGPPNLPTSAGPGIVKLLAEELEHAGVHVKKRAAIALKGEYLLVEVEVEDPNNPVAPKRKFLAIRIVVSVVDQFGQVLTDFNFEGEVGPAGQALASISDGKFENNIQDERTIVELLGIPASLPADEPEEDRDSRLRDALIDPPSYLTGQTQLFAGPGSPYGIEIFVGGQARPITLDEGLPFVKIDRGEIYEVRIINNSPFDAAVALSIDGLSVFEFSDLRFADGPKQGRPIYDHYIVPKQNSVRLIGWHRTNSVVDSFLVTEFAKGNAAKVFHDLLQHEAELGTITATFSAAWPTDGSPPADEPAAKKGVPNLTGSGPPKTQEVQELRRNIGERQESVPA